MSQLYVLRKIGLSKTGIRCYACLLEQGPATTRRLAERLDVPPTNLYGVLARLAEQGFIRQLKLTSRPALLIARPLNQAMREYYAYQVRLVMQLCRELNLPPPPLPRPVFNAGQSWHTNKHERKANIGTD